MANPNRAIKRIDVPALQVRQQCPSPPGTFGRPTPPNGPSGVPYRGPLGPTSMASGDQFGGGFQPAQAVQQAAGQMSSNEVGGQNPGGDLLRQFVPHEIDVFERLFQTLPEEGMFVPGITPQNPFQFTVGSFTVPTSMTLWLEHYECGVLLPDPLNPGDYRYAEDGRFSGNMGFEVKVSDGRNGNISYQLDPVPITASRQEFEQVVVRPGTSTSMATNGQFDRSAAVSFAATAGSGSSLEPPRRHPAGPISRAYVWPIGENMVVSVKCVIWRRILTPFAGIYAQLSGHLMHSNIAEVLANRGRPR